MSAVATAPRGVRGRLVLSGGVRRRFAVLVELLVAVAITLGGYYLGAPWFKTHEAEWTVRLLKLLGEDRVSSALPRHILMFRPGGEVLDGEVTTSCSSILTVVGLTALAAVVLRRRRWHALYGLSVALVAVVIANVLRLMASTLAGVYWGRPAMIGFHDWVGTIWTLASTLVGFLIMVWLTLPTPERAEQDVAGRHTARRPNSWARPGLGYRVEDLESPAGSHRRSFTGLMHRYVLPRAVSRRLGARREAGRIDYRIGHLPPEERAAAVRVLVADGLGAHVASLLAVATYERDVVVLDALADAVAARQWEPLTNDRVAAVRLWARGWLLARRTAADRPVSREDEPGHGDDGHGDDGDDTAVLPLRTTPPVPVPVPRAARPPGPPPAGTLSAGTPSAGTPSAHRSTPRSFARPSPGGASLPEDLR